MNLEDLLGAARKKINTIDEEILALLCDRLKISDEIGKIKKEMGKAVFDESREQELLEKIRKIAEEKNIYGMRRGIVAIKKIRKGDLFSIENLGVKRPLVGMLPSEIENLFGKVASMDIENDEPILKENIEW